MILDPRFWSPQSKAPLSKLKYFSAFLERRSFLGGHVFEAFQKLDMEMNIKTPFIGLFVFLGEFMKHSRIKMVTVFSRILELRAEPNVTFIKFLGVPYLR